jgi:alkanesulfonate monooxygenase SsuD/methylene tetrahydromethanopterin reductase-like flavin-dependent oxidoreductase (luciferase family)
LTGSRLPVLVGGQSPAALRRAATYGDGWCGFNLTPGETARAVSEIRRLRAANGRAAEPFEFSVAPVNTASSTDLTAYRDAGIDELYLTPVFRHPLASEAEAITLLEELARGWVEPAARL